MESKPVQLSTEEQWVLSQRQTLKFEGSLPFQKHLKNAGNVVRDAGIVNRFYSLKYTSILQRKLYQVATFSHFDVSYAGIYWSGDNIEFVALSPPLESKDGEYRLNLTRWDAFEEIYERNDWGELELSLLSSGLNIEIFSTTEGDLPDFIENSRAALKTLIWVLANHNKAPLRQMSNLPTNYDEIIKSSIQEHKVTDMPYKQLRIHNDMGHPAGGIKLSLMTLREAGNPMNIEFPVWRELVLMQWCSDTVINRRCSSFPIYGDSAFVGGHIDNIISNTSLSQRLDTDTVARHALRKLDESRQIIDQKPSFRYWDRRVFEAIQVAERDLIISDSAVLSIMQNVGFTWGSVPVEGSERETILLNAVDKIIFDVCYAAFVLHDVAIHGDLHVNNLTFRVQKTYEGIMHAMYIMSESGEADAFAIPVPRSAGSDVPTGYVIDFSQSVITHPEKVTEDVPDNFYKSQLQQVIRILRRWLPNFLEKHQDLVSGLALTDLGKLAKALVFVDYYAIGQSACQRFSGKLSENLQKVALQILTQNLLIAIGKADGEMTSEVEFFHKVFAKYEYRKQKITELRAVVAASLPMTYSGRKYDAFPTWGKLDELEKHSDRPTEDLVHLPNNPYHDDKFSRPATAATQDLIAEVAKAQFRDSPPAQVGVTWF